jgi:hypothetical protein
MKIFKSFTKKLTACLLILFAINAHAVRTTTYYHTDGLGSVVAASDESGNLLWRKSYAPYGEQIDGNTDNEPVSYTGKKHDDVLVHNCGGSRGYDRPEIETKSGVAVKQKEATDKWDEFLGTDQTNIDPRDGLADRDRIWSADGKRSIRFGEHEMNSSSSKYHYHQETWHDDRVENVLQRIPQ